ncbi:hypothetical protein QBC38DRAFT_162837 [Podospora fimiseda]|uniref:Uncharacterized protein n=1 Tax=Podospora fimiseda TaxID=252190 RepID=A0AAN7BRK4_9PEZI|nr:hypothetical protein QBC38DRAFT_162837 [Podospora fimiseda]
MHGVVTQLGIASPSLSSSSTPTTPSASASVRAITVAVSECCQSNTPPVNFGPSSTFTTITTSSTPPVVLPSETSDSQSSSTGSVSPAVIAGTVIGAAVLIFIAAFFFFVCHRRKNPNTGIQRRSRGRRRTTRMYSYPGEYQTVPVNHPNSPPSHSPTPSSDSSLSTQGLLDMASYANDQHENEYTYIPQDNTTTANCHHHHIKNQPSTDTIFHLAALSPRGDRRSVDTIFALRFYYTHELDRRSKGSFLAELPSSPILPPVPPLPSSPPPPPPPPQTSSSKSRLSRFSHSTNNNKRKTYLTPAGEPWKPLPPPIAPLPAVPPPSSSPQNNNNNRRSTNPTFSLFPKPPSHNNKPLRPAPLNISKNINTSRVQHQQPVVARSAPLNMNPITNSIRGHIRSLGSAPLPCSSTPKIIVQQASAPTTPPLPIPNPPGSAPLPSTNTFHNNNNNGRFNSTLLTPPIGTGEFAPPPTATTTRGRISMKGIEGGRTTRNRIKSLPGGSGSNSPRRGFGWLAERGGMIIGGMRPRSPSGGSATTTNTGGPRSFSTPV